MVGVTAANVPDGSRLCEVSCPYIQIEPAKAVRDMRAAQFRCLPRYPLEADYDPHGMYLASTDLNAELMGMPLSLESLLPVLALRFWLVIDK